MGFTTGDIGSKVGKIAILLLGCHCTSYEFRGYFTLRFLPHDWILIAFGSIMGYRGNLVVGGIIGVIFLLTPP